MFYSILCKGENCMNLLRFVALSTVLALLVGCSGVTEVAPDKAKSGDIKGDIEKANKGMDEAMSKMNLPPGMQEKMKSSMGGKDFKLDPNMKNEKKSNAPAGAGAGGPSAPAGGGAPK